MNKSIRIDLVDFWHKNTPVEKEKNPLFRMLSKRFDLVLSDQPDFLIYSCFGHDHLNYDCIRIFYAGENRRPHYAQCDYSFSFDYPVNERNYRLPLYRLYDEYALLQQEKDVDAILRDKTDFCNFVYSNEKARTRIAFFRDLSAHRKVDSGGRVLNNIGYRVGDKIEFMRRYKFSIAFENGSHPGYTTEKIIQPMVAHSIPIYWGNPLVARDFNPGSFVNCHDFPNFERVIERVMEIDACDDLYRQYLAEPYFVGNVEPDFLNEDRILDRFEEIFSDMAKRPVARSWKNSLFKIQFRMKRLGRSRKRARSSQSNR